MDEPQQQPKYRFNEAARRTVVVHEPTNRDEPLTIYCRTPAQLGATIEWLAEKCPKLYETYTSFVKPLKAIGNIEDWQRVREHPSYSAIQSLNFWNVDMPARIGKNGTARCKPEGEERPDEQITLYGISLHPSKIYEIEPIKTLLRKEGGLQTKNFANIPEQKSNIPSEQDRTNIVVNQLLEIDCLKRR